MARSSNQSLVEVFQSISIPKVSIDMENLGGVASLGWFNKGERLELICERELVENANQIIDSVVRKSVMQISSSNGHDDSNMEYSILIDLERCNVTRFLSSGVIESFDFEKQSNFTETIQVLTAALEKATEGYGRLRARMISVRNIWLLSCYFVGNTFASPSQWISYFETEFPEDFNNLWIVLGIIVGPTDKTDEEAFATQTTKVINKDMTHSKVKVLRIFDRGVCRVMDLSEFTNKVQITCDRCVIDL